MLDDKLQRYLTTSGNEICCWAGISPGITIESEAIDILTRLYGAQNVSLSNTPVQWINWKSNGADFSRDGSVRMVENRVYDIHVDIPDERAEVKDLLEAIGEPYFVNLVISRNPSRCSGAFLSYPQIGLEVTLYMAGESIGVKNNQFISGFKISAPWTPKDKEWFQILWTDSIKIRWDGYREYCPESNSP